MPFLKTSFESLAPIFAAMIFALCVVWFVDRGAGRERRRKASRKMSIQRNNRLWDNPTDHELHHSAAGGGNGLGPAIDRP